MSLSLAPVRVVSFRWGSALLALLLAVVALVACAPASPEVATPAAPVPTIPRADAPPAPIAQADEDGPLPLGPADPTWGERSALVTMVTFGDFQCPFCARVSTTLEALKREYGPDKLRIAWKHMPLDFHHEARPAAEAGAAVMLAAGSEAFWRFHDRAFASQISLSSAPYEDWAKDAGADVNRFRSFMANGAAAKKVDADRALAERVGANGTPAFFVNGTLLAGAQPLEKFRSTIDAELEKARVKVAAGVPKARLHAVLSQENFAKPARRDDDDEPEDTTVYKVSLAGAPARGPKTALVTVVMFSDYQCPFCKRAADTWSGLEARYKGQLRFVWRDLPLVFHKRAEPAAELAREAMAQKGEAAFWAAGEKLFAGQQHLEDDDLERYAMELGLDVKRAMAAVKQRKHRALIDADMALADDFGAQGTPTFFLNGRKVVGAQPADKLASILDAEIVKAQALIAKGTAPEALYEALTKDGKGPTPPDSRTVKVHPGAPISGPATAPVTIHVFSDFQCPFCERALATMDEIKKAYGARVRFMWHNLPLAFHADAHLAAEAALEAKAQKGDRGFWQMHDLLFQSQKRGEGLKRDSLEANAARVGVDKTRFLAALDQGTHRARVDEELKEAEAANISGTPTFVIASAKPDGGSQSGYLLSGAQGFSKFKKLIDRALVDAKVPVPARPTVEKAAPRAPVATPETKRP